MAEQGLHNGGTFPASHPSPPAKGLGMHRELGEDTARTDDQRDVPHHAGSRWFPERRRGRGAAGRRSRSTADGAQGNLAGKTRPGKGRDRDRTEQGQP